MNNPPNTPDGVSGLRPEHVPGPRRGFLDQHFFFRPFDARRALSLRYRAAVLATLVIGCSLLVAAAAASQAGQMAPYTPPPPRQAGINGEPEPDPLSRSMEEQMLIKRTTERQKTIVADTTKLLELATELKTEVDKSNKNQLSLSVVKKAEEVEKLARSVKEKMKGF